MKKYKHGKQLIFVHNWVGPNGPLNNFKIPDIHDLVDAIPYYNLEKGPAPEHSPIVREIKKLIPCKIVSSYEIDTIGDSPFMYEILLTPNLDYEKILLSNGIGVLERSPVPFAVWEKIINGNGYILLTVRYESFVDYQMFNRIHSYFTSHGVPMNKIIYLSNCANCKEVYAKYCRQHGITDTINCEYIGLYLQINKGILQDKRYAARQDMKKAKEKLFLNFNRRHRPHRYLLLLKMIENNLLDDCYMSFSKDGGSSLPYEHWLADTEAICRKYNIKLSREEIDNLYHKLPFVLDSDKFYRFPVEDELLDTASWYDKTTIHLASETNFENNVIHLTEKTIKPIIFKQAFIIVGPAKTLAYLKKLGFKTFSDFWDESYDDEIDAAKRMDKIIQVMKQIKSWPDDSIGKFLKRTNLIREYNFNVMKTLEPLEAKEFLETYGAYV